MARLTTVAGQNAFSGNHAWQVVRVGFPANQHALATFGGSLHGIFRAKDSLAHCSARACVKASGQHFVSGILVELRMQQLVKLVGINTRHSFFASDKAFFFHIDGNANGCGSGALTHAGLQHIKLALLNGKFDVAHVAEVVFEHLEDAFQFFACFFQARNRLKFGDRAGVANARDHVFALGVHQVVAVEFLFARSGVARKGHARSGCFTLVAEYHGLNVYRRTHGVINLVLLAI